MSKRPTKKNIDYTEEICDDDSREGDFDNDDVDADPTFEPIQPAPRTESPTEPQLTKKRKQKSYKKKVQKDWGHEEILLLIKEIEARTALWDMSSADYKTPKDSIWKEVADKLERDQDDCKGKWTNLRITFKNNMAKYRAKKSGQGTDDSIEITWRYFRSMLFLEANDIGLSAESTTSMPLVNIPKHFSLFPKMLDDFFYFRRLLLTNHQF